MSAQAHTPTRANASRLRADQVDTLVTHALNAPMSVVDNTLRVVYVNASFARWFQRTPAEATGLMLADLYGSEALDQIQGHIDRVLSGETVHYQRQIANPAGEAEWHNVSLSPWLDDDGQVLGFVSIALRVHELKFDVFLNSRGFIVCELMAESGHHRVVKRLGIFSENMRQYEIGKYAPICLGKALDRFRGLSFASSVRTISLCVYR